MWIHFEYHHRKRKQFTRVTELDRLIVMTMPEALLKLAHITHRKRKWFDIKVVEIEIRTKFNIFKTNVNINRSSDGKEKNVFTKLIVGILVVNVNQMFVSLSRDFFNFGL